VAGGLPAGGGSQDWSLDVVLVHQEVDWPCVKWKRVTTTTTVGRGVCYLARYLICGPKHVYYGVSTRSPCAGFELHFSASLATAIGYDSLETRPKGPFGGCSLVLPLGTGPVQGSAFLRPRAPGTGPFPTGCSPGTERREYFFAVPFVCLLFQQPSRVDYQALLDGGQLQVSASGAWIHEVGEDIVAVHPDYQQKIGFAVGFNVGFINDFLGGSCLQLISADDAL